MIDIVPAVLPKSYEELSAKAGLVRGLVPRVQIDVANATYAPSTTWPYGNGDHFEAILEENEGLPFWDEIDYEVDLLITEPEKEIDRWIQAGIAAAILHIESSEHLRDALVKLREMNVEVGLGIKPGTPTEALFQSIETHGMPDFVQCMGSDDIGRHGVALDENVYAKIREIRKRFPELLIAVDIGVSEETAPKLIEAGATKLVSGSAIFAQEDIREAIAYFKNLS